MAGGRGAAGSARSNPLSGFLGEHSVLCFAQMYRDKGGGRRELNGEREERGFHQPAYP